MAYTFIMLFWLAVPQPNKPNAWAIPMENESVCEATIKSVAGDHPELRFQCIPLMGSEKDEE